MDFLLDPNVAYLILLAGVLRGFLSLVTPGTGLFEAGALLCALVSTYTIYNLSFNLWALIILGISVIPFLYAIQKPKRELFLLLSIFLMVAGSVFIFPASNGGMAVNPFLAVMASTLVAGFIWVAIRKSMEAAMVRPIHDLDGLIGKVGKARTVINSDGSVQVDGELWSARSENSIPEGSEVRVIRRDGFVVLVEKINL